MKTNERTIKRATFYFSLFAALAWVNVPKLLAFGPQQPTKKGYVEPDYFAYSPSVDLIDFCEKQENWQTDDSCADLFFEVKGSMTCNGNVLKYYYLNTTLSFMEEGKDPIETLDDFAFKTKTSAALSNSKNQGQLRMLVPYVADYDYTFYVTKRRFCLDVMPNRDFCLPIDISEGNRTKRSYYKKFEVPAQEVFANDSLELDLEICN